MRLLIGLIMLGMVLLVCNAMEEVAYEGLRLDMSALTLNRDIIRTITPALNRTLNATFHSMNETGSFWTALHLTNMRITYYKIHEERFDINKYTYNAPTYQLKGAFESIYFHISFHYRETWLGIPISTGQGSAAITNVNNLILVFFNESDPDVQLPHPWDIKNLTMGGIFAPTTWVQSTLHKHFIPTFHRVVDDAMYDFAHNLLRTYRYIEDVFPHDIDLIFRNDILSVTPTVGGMYLTIAFKTNITVNNYIHKKMYRKMNGTIVPKGDFDYCLAAQLVPDVMDALGKGGYYDSDVPGSLWGFSTETVREFFDIMPTLHERYTGDETFAIHCQNSRFETVNDITQRDSEYPVPQLQNPQYCFIYVVSTGEYFLLVDIFMRFYYEMKCKEEAFYGHILYAELYNYKTLPVLPESKRLLLEPHLKSFVDFFHDSELISPGVKVVPNRHDDLKFDWAYIMKDEICFYYKEIHRPNEPAQITTN